MKQDAKVFITEEILEDDSRGLITRWFGVLSNDIQGYFCSQVYVIKFRISFTVVDRILDHRRPILAHVSEIQTVVKMVTKELTLQISNCIFWILNNLKLLGHSWVILWFHIFNFENLKY